MYCANLARQVEHAADISLKLGGPDVLTQRDRKQSGSGGVTTSEAGSLACVSHGLDMRGAGDRGWYLSVSGEGT